jgi:hypothetical protein
MLVEHPVLRNCITLCSLSSSHVLIVLEALPPNSIFVLWRARQSFFWHPFEQYVATRHFAHRSSFFPAADSEPQTKHLWPVRVTMCALPAPKSRSPHPPSTGPLGKAWSYCQCSARSTVNVDKIRFVLSWGSLSSNANGIMQLGMNARNRNQAVIAKRDAEGNRTNH